MSEHMAAEIRIGGSINAELGPALCEAIQQAQVSVDWSGTWFQPHTARDLLAARRDRTGLPLLILSDESACWGEFPDLERFLREHALAYDRLTDGRWEFDPHTAH